MYVCIITVQILLSNQSVILLINTHHTEQLYESEGHIGHRGSFPLFSFHLSPPTPHHIYVSQACTDALFKVTINYYSYALVIEDSWWCQSIQF